MLELIAALILLTRGESTHFDYHVSICKIQMCICTNSFVNKGLHKNSHKMKESKEEVGDDLSVSMLKLLP